MDKRPDVLWNPCIRSLLSPGSGTAWASSRGRSRVRIGRDQSVHMAQAAITDRNDIDPADYRLTGRPDTPRQRGSVGPNVGGPVLLVDEARQGAIEQLLSLVAQLLPPDKFSFWFDEPHVFRIGPLDGRPSASRVPLGKHLVQVAVKQLLRVRHAIESSRPEGS
jgi:hypothetical protein